MGNVCACTLSFKKLKLSDTPCSMGASSDSEYVTQLASGSEPATTSSSQFFPARTEGMSSARTKESGKCTSVEDLIERSKVHWSQLTEFSDSDEDEVAEVSNAEVFKELQSHPQWGQFFKTFGYNTEVFRSAGSLEVGEKFAEGGQAEILHAKVTWNDLEMTKWDLENGIEYVLKVFRKGTFVRHLQKQWPHGMFQYDAERREQQRLGKPSECDVVCGTLLKDGRFTFLFVRETENLRTYIDRFIEERVGQDGGPFSKEAVEIIMYVVAEGMNWLHNRNIIHRDLKSSNVLITFNKNKNWTCYVVDFECSIGVVGTRYFRAPEILQALKDEVVNKRPNLFTKAVDVYSYGMTCYEILIGKLPFEGHATSDCKLVLDGLWPDIPNYVEDWVGDLLSRCWQSDPTTRPTF